MSNPNGPLKRNYKTLPTFKLKWLDGFGVPSGTVAPPLVRGTKTMPTLKMEMVRPKLHLEFELGPDADRLEATQAIQKLLDSASEQYRSIGGTELRYDRDQIRSGSTKGVLRVDLTPQEAGENAVLRERLKQVEQTIVESQSEKSKPNMLFKVVSWKIDGF